MTRCYRRSSAAAKKKKKPIKREASKSLPDALLPEWYTYVYMIGQTAESGIPPPFRASVWYNSRIHLPGF